MQVYRRTSTFTDFVSLLVPKDAQMELKYRSTPAAGEKPGTEHLELSAGHLKVELDKSEIIRLAGFFKAIAKPEK